MTVPRPPVLRDYRDVHGPVVLVPKGAFDAFFKAYKNDLVAIGQRLVEMYEAKTVSDEAVILLLQFLEELYGDDAEMKGKFQTMLATFARSSIPDDIKQTALYNWASGQM